MKRRFTILSAALALLVSLAIPMGMWGQTTHTIGWGTASGDAGTYTNFTEVSGQVAGVLSFSSEKNSSGSNPAYNANNSELRLYYASSGDGGSITITPASGVTITGAVMTTSTTPSVKYYVDGGTGTSVTASNNTYTISNISVSNSLKIQNANTTNTQLRIKTIALTYTTGGSVPTTCTVTYNSNVAGTAPVVDTYVEGDNVTLRAANTFTNEGYTFSEWNTQANGDGDAYEAEGTIENIQSDIDLYAQWEELDPNTDVLNYDFTGIDGTSYAGWTNTSTLGTVYVGQSGGQYSSIQLRTNNNNSGIVTTLSLGNATKVAVNWNSNTQDGRVLNVYGKAAAYSAVTDLYNETSQGELLGTIVKGTSTELTITGNYAYIGLRSDDGAMYLDEIRITWEISNDPVCTVTPDTHEFGNVAIGSTATQSFTVSTANLTGDLTLSMSNTAYTVAPTTIEQNASTTQVTITFAPTSAGEFDASLIVNGSGFINEEVALVSGTGASVRTITFNSGNGTCETQTMSGVDGATINLPTATPSTACDAAGWTFAGWSASNVEETTTTPTLITGEYTINGDATLYAVYSLIEASTTQETVFNFGDIATANSWKNGVAYTSVLIAPITITANGGGNNAKYYTSDKTWRMYNGGSITITAADGKSITAVASNPSTTFTINTDGTASQSFTATVKFKSITVTYSNGPATVTYATSPACLEPVATPTFSPEDGTIFYEDELEVTISCTTEDATIYYTLDGSVPTNESSVYNGTITLTETTTVKAIAMKEGMADSEIAEATYTQLPLSTIAEVRAQGTGSVITKGIVTHMSGVTAYIQDETAAIVVYGSNVPAVGDEIRVSGTLTSYKGLLEIGSNNNPPTITVLSQGHTVEPTVMTIEAINTDAAGNNAYQAKLVRIENATYNNGTVSQGDNSITVYGTLAGVNDGNIVSFTGNIGCYNSVQIVNPTDIIVSYRLTIPAFNTGGYRLISSPVATVDNPTNPTQVANMITDPVNGSNTYDLYAFDQDPEDGSGKEWRNYRATSEGFELEFGHGYLYGNLSDVELVFTGTAYNGDGKVTLTKTNNTSADFPGWNLVGNPFGVTAYITKPYYTMNSTGSEIIGTSGNSVEAMEGIFVVANTNGEKMTFSTEAPTKTGSNLTLNLTDGGSLIDRAIVSFSESEQLPKFQLNRNSTKLYIPQDGKDYAVVCSEEMGAMPVNFKAEDNGTYSMNFSCENVGFAYLHLIDNKTGNDVDLLQTPSYSFEAKTTDYESRFKLVFATGDNSDDDTFAFYSNGSFVINNEGNATLQVIDITGRIVKSESVNGCANVNVNAAPGVYMLRLINGDNVKTQKVVVK